MVREQNNRCRRTGPGIPFHADSSAKNKTKKKFRKNCSGFPRVLSPQDPRPRLHVPPGADHPGAVNIRHVHDLELGGVGGGVHRVVLHERCPVAGSAEHGLDMPGPGHRVGCTGPVCANQVGAVRPGNACPVVVIGKDIEPVADERAVFVVELSERFLLPVLHRIRFCFGDKLSELRVEEQVFAGIDPGPDPVLVIDRADIADLVAHGEVLGRVRVLVEEVSASLLCERDLGPCVIPAGTVRQG